MTKSVQHEIGVVPPTVVSLLAMRAEEQPRRVGYRFASDDGSAQEEITYSELDQRARAIACTLASLRLHGKPVMLLYPAGIDYVASFFGCLYAGAIAVPACPPDPQRMEGSLPGLVAIARDAAPSAVLTTAAISDLLPQFFTASPALSQLPRVTSGDIPEKPSLAWEPARVGADTIAVLQYTSGSTSAPRGVVLTHRNLMSNSALIYRFFGHSADSRAISWLPLYHDMGLIGGILQPLYGGFPVTLMSSDEFLRRPIRWLEEISRAQATTSGGPNFAYDLCVRRTTAGERAQLDLSSWQVAVNGAEPVRAETLENFARAFAPAGFRREAFHPCYGLAEATLIVTGGLRWPQRGVESFDAAGLRYGTAIPGAAGPTSRSLVSCGVAPPDGRLVIVDPNTHMERPPGEVGEIWIAGPSVAHAYWRRQSESRQTFEARLAGTGEGPFMRSGDLGFMRRRQLFVTGRIKDLIIVCGRNHYPQDIEVTAGRSSAVLRPGCAAAFTVPDGDQERLVIGHEIRRQAGDVDVGKVADAIRAAVAAEHQIGVHTVVLVPAGGIPKTTSGKIQRQLCAAMFTADQLPEIGRSTISHLAGTGEIHLDRSNLLAAPSRERRSLLQDYLSGLAAAACGIDGATIAADVPLLAVGIDSCAALSIQYSIRMDLGVHVTMARLARGVTIADLAALLDEQFSAAVPLAASEAPAPVPPAAPAEAKSDVRLYCWTNGSRVPAHSGPAPDGPKATTIRGKRSQRAS